VAETNMCDLNWTAIGTMALAVIAFGSFWLQLHFSRKQSRETREAVDKMIGAQLTAAREENGVRLYLDMRERWDSERMQQQRKALAASFKNTPANQRTDQFFEQIKEDVLNFFEDLGSMLKHKLVAEQLVYDLLSYHVKGWYAVCGPYIVQLQAKKKDDSLFADFKFLSERMMELEVKERGTPRSQLELNEDEVKNFLQEEYEV
jgi:hypothetical protein